MRMNIAEKISFVAMAAFVLIVVALIIGMFFGLGTARAPSDYSGHVVDVELDKGMVFRTSQAHLKTHRRSSEGEVFCIPQEREDELGDKLRTAMREGHRVTIEYSRPYIVSPWHCDATTSVIRDIEVVNETASA